MTQKHILVVSKERSDFLYAEIKRIKRDTSDRFNNIYMLLDLQNELIEYIESNQDYEKDPKYKVLKNNYYNYKNKCDGKFLQELEFASMEYDSIFNVNNDSEKDYEIIKELVLKKIEKELNHDFN